MKLFKDIDLNIKYLDEMFKDCDDIVKRKFPIGESKKQWAFIMYADSMTDRTFIERAIMVKLIGLKIDFGKNELALKEDLFAAIKDNGITTPDIKEDNLLEALCKAVLSGDTIIIFDGLETAVVASTKGAPNRGVPSVETEAVVQGSKDAFSEVFRFNTVLIRRRIRDTNLKVKQYKLGRRSGTDVALMYLDDVVRHDILEEAQRRLRNIDIDAILDSGYVEQLIEDDWLSPFPQVLVTERPDKAASAILEGRIVIVVDNSPVVLIIPSTLNTFFQSSEDYYQRFEIMSFTRAMRFFAAFIAVTLPGLYIAVTVYHPSMVPLLLSFKMAAAQQSIPFPAVIEILIMDLSFELLREAGIRLPSPVGSSIGIVGGLIVGQAAVEAGIVSPVVVIIIALTGIASFLIPNYQLTAGFRLTKYLVILFSATLGLLGFWVAMLVILIHLASLKTFGIPYLFPYVAGGFNGHGDMRDSFFRVPLMFMRKRPFFANPKQSTRLNPAKSGNKRTKE